MLPVSREGSQGALPTGSVARGAAGLPTSRPPRRLPGHRAERRAWMLTLAHSRPDFGRLSLICDSRNEAAWLAQIQLLLVADGDSGFSQPQPETIDVRLSASGALAPVPTSGTE